MLAKNRVPTSNGTCPVTTQQANQPLSVLPSPTVSSSDSGAAKSENALARLQALLTEPSVLQAIQGGATRGRKPSALATLPPTQRYLTEKRVGLRRENGAMKLKRLTARHYGIIGRHLEGKSLEQICQECHVTISTASRVLNDPLAKELLAKVYGHREQEIHALAGHAIKATRDALTGDYDIGTKLRGVDKFVKIRETMIDKEKGRETAEDVVTKLLEKAQINGDVNIQVNQK